MVQTDPLMSLILAIVGPTGIGKSRLALNIAKDYSAEILSADAFQFYRGLDIGTAKIRPREQEGIVHHFLDILDPSESFSVHDYQRLAREKIDSLQHEGKLPILVGGSGLYINAVYYDYRFLGNKRHEFDHSISSLTTEKLYEQLKMINPDLSATIHPNNRRRILRSLEIAMDISQDDTLGKKRPHYPNWTTIGLTMPRDQLYQRLETRVDQMIQSGLENEARYLFEYAAKSQAAMAIGYKEFFPYFQGELSRIDVIAQIKQNTRRYAKRQLTWFRNQMNCTWFIVNPDRFEDTIEQVRDYLKKEVRSTT
ncbi:MAG: tRNA (adenosine(37)-N6)-dimethylallyltransferase MiaA [Candidatus Izemoplasmatales bacterium]|jgi:tRNA dimethylallyltransferase|nr:tRNA (adenosine(37)-N6)-dimethylallyltransferase MiaA [Candidatus Izemoplasmatales bacterium]MDD4354361.1 tRNA (adenosine(37)-N6)-dimethylallyltransferase MiaA [Candidatus Izemoplasmatales bacterium]MDD4987690.1 tRNA (adenosine(37)-N6)-dimethylallyltransferase MiaA [Candidatus Izemoplasmatales bacterium]MDY0372753.1 tRNA (adenosine(37)-N6)-dimethylallyltransferase MiaA [Candidatus Izemoplasmatales bacterium]